MFEDVQATAAERSVARPGDELLDPADVVMDRAFTVTGTPEAVWPWIVQLGKRRAGWYLPRPVERFIPRNRRATRVLQQRWQNLSVGDVVPDWGGRTATFDVASIQPPTSLVYRSRRRRTEFTWSITLEQLSAAKSSGHTRVFLRLRLAPAPTRFARIGEAFDLVTVAGMAAGLRERLADSVLTST